MLHLTVIKQSVLLLAHLSKELRPVFMIDGKCIENVDKWSHLGHLIHVNCNDIDDIKARINCHI